MAVTPLQFQEQLEVLAARYHVVSLHELAHGIRGRRRGALPVAITFDDGYADNLHAALPRLEARGLPATFFITTGYVDSGRAFWWDELEQLVSCPPKLATRRAGAGSSRRPTPMADDDRGRADDGAAGIAVHASSLDRTRDRGASRSDPTLARR